MLLGKSSSFTNLKFLAILGLLTNHDSRVRFQASVVIFLTQMLDPWHDPWDSEVPKGCLRHTLLAISTLHPHAIDAVALLGLVAHLPSLTSWAKCWKPGPKNRTQQDSMLGRNQQYLAE